MSSRKKWTKSSRTKTSPRRSKKDPAKSDRAKSEESARYGIYAAARFAQDLARAEPADRRWLEKQLRRKAYPQLGIEPHFGTNIKKLRDWSPPTWRFRLGNWRLFYEIDDKASRVYLTVLDRRSKATYADRRASFRR